MNGLGKVKKSNPLRKVYSSPKLLRLTFFL